MTTEVRAELLSPLQEPVAVALLPVNGLLHYYPMEESSGAAIADTVNGFDATVLNDPGTVTESGYIGRGRDLPYGDGSLSGAFISLAPTEVDGYALTEWSIGIPVFLRQESEAFFDILVCGAYRSNDSTIIFYTRNGGLEIDLQDDAGLSRFAQSAAIEPGLFDRWMYCIVTCDGSNIRVYADSLLLMTVARPVLLRPRQKPFAIGGMPDDGEIGFTPWGQYFSGIVDEVSIWNRALTASEVVSLSLTGTAANTWPLPDFDWEVRAELESPLQPINATADVQTAALVELPSPLQPVRIVARMDFSVLVDPLTTRIYYAMDIQDESTTLRVPISTWQATVQNDRSSYAQAIIPGISETLAAIEAMTDPDFVIYRGAEFADGGIQETEMVRAPLSLRYDLGPENESGTIYGYAQLTLPEGASERVLQGVRSISVDGDTRRARSDLDFFLRPGDTVQASTISFAVAYINYYVIEGDEYMDVGSRV